jgi:hypothetical protein
MMEVGTYTMASRACVGVEDEVVSGVQSKADGAGKSVSCDARTGRFKK